MKRKNLLELELSIPTVDLVESRTLSGGGYGPPGPFPWDENAWPMGFCLGSWWSGLWDRDRGEWEDRDPNDEPKDPRDEINDQEWGYDDERDDERDYERPPDIGLGDQTLPPGFVPGHTDVKVENGFCVPGTLAAAAQAVFGTGALSAYTQAMQVLDGILPSTTPENGGIPISADQFAQALTEMGFRDVQHGGNWLPWVATGGNFAIHVSGDSPAHAVLVTGFNETTMRISYYDSTTGQRHTEELSKFLERGGYVIRFR